MRSHWRVGVAAGLSLALLLSACGGDDDEAAAPDTADPAAEPDGGEEPTSDPVAAPPCEGDSTAIAFSASEGSVATVQYAAYVAGGMDYYAEMGLDYEFVGLSGTGTILGAVQSGDADVGVLTMGGPINAINEGASLRAVASLQEGATLAIPLTADAAERLGIEKGDVVTADKIAEAEGLRIGVSSAGGGGHTFGTTIMSAGGLVEGEDYTIEILGDAAAMVAAFGRDLIDAYVASTSTAAAAVEEFGGAYLYNPAYQTMSDISDEVAHLDQQQGAIVAANSERFDDEDYARRLTCIVAAMAKANELILEDPEAAADAAWEFFEPVYSDNEELYRELALGLEPITSESPVLQREIIEGSLAYNNQTAETPIELEFEELVDNRFAEEALELLEESS